MNRARRIPRRTAQADRRDGKRGFTLIEIALVLVLIGILAAMAVSSYRMMINRARMTQAKSVLGHLTRTQTIYFGDHERYTDNVSLLDFDPVKYDYYQVSVQLDNGAKGYTGIATGVGPMAGDRWYVTEGGEPYQDGMSPFR